MSLLNWSERLKDVVSVSGSYSRVTGLAQVISLVKITLVVIRTKCFMFSYKEMNSLKQLTPTWTQNSYQIRMHFKIKKLKKTTHDRLYTLILGHSHRPPLRVYLLYLEVQCNVVVEKTLESPLDCKEIQPVHPKGNQSWIFIERADAEAETPILWPPGMKSWLVGRDPDAGQDWRQEKGTTEDEMVRWHHRFNGH